MSFRCDTCNHAILGVKPITRVAETRLKDYFDLDAKDIPHLVGSGFETVRELRECPTCAGIKLAVKVEPDFTGSITFANGFTRTHAKNCNGEIKRKRNGVTTTAPCPTCAEIVRTFAAMGPHELNLALSEPHRPAFFTSHMPALSIEVVR